MLYAVTPTCHTHRRERHDIPLIVQTCIDEIERRGMSEVGIYRVAGILRDVTELRQAFDTGTLLQCKCVAIYM